MSYTKKTLTIICLIYASNSLSADTPVQPGQNEWSVYVDIANTVDAIQSKLDLFSAFIITEINDPTISYLN